MICIRQDLIDKELCRNSTGRVYKKLKLSNRFIDWLLSHYYVAEFTEHYYDSDLAKDRLTYLVWIEPYGEGIWNMSQATADKAARNALKYVRKTNVKKDGRIWIAYEDDYIFIYWYGRDFMEVDYWWVMKRR